MGRGSILAHLAGLLGAGCLPNIDALQACSDGACADSGAVEDARAAVDGGAPHEGCAGRLCSSFDPPNHEVPFGWAEARGDATAFELAKSTSSPPNALRLRADATATTRSLAVKFSAATSFSLKFSIRVETLAGAASDVVLMRAACVGAQGLELKLKRTGRLQIQYEIASVDVEGATPSSGWVPVTVEWNLSTGFADLAIPGAMNSLTTPAQRCENADASFGFVDLGKTRDGTWDVLVDDVVIDWK